MNDHHEPDWPDIIDNHTHQIGKTARRIADRYRRAEQSAELPTDRPQLETITGRSTTHADPVQHTATERAHRLIHIRAAITSIAEELDDISRQLAKWDPHINNDNRCHCPKQCCPQGCTRTCTDSGNEHPTCRQKRARARRRGEQWAMTEPS